MHVTERMARDLEMVNDPNNWPIWPVLPMKRNPERKPSEAFLYGDPPAPDEPITLYVGNIYGIMDAGQGSARLVDLPKLTYPDAAEMINDGWMVD